VIKTLEVAFDSIVGIFQCIAALNLDWW